MNLFNWRIKFCNFSDLNNKNQTFCLHTISFACFRWFSPTDLYNKYCIAKWDIELQSLISKSTITMVQSSVMKLIFNAGKHDHITLNLTLFLASLFTYIDMRAYFPNPHSSELAPSFCIGIHKLITRHSKGGLR